MSDIIKHIGDETKDWIALGPAADWPEVDQAIYLWIRDGALDPNIGFGEEGWGERVLTALSVLNRIESGGWKVVERGDES